MLMRILQLVPEHGLELSATSEGDHKSDTGRVDDKPLR
jgi:hypothetical protein